MEIKKLIEVLENEILALQEMRDIAYSKQSALINRDRDELDECIKLEEANIIKVKHSELARIKILEELYSTENIPMKDHKLKEFLSNFSGLLDPKIVTFIEDVESKIKILVQKITDVNRNNLFLIRHSLKFIDSTITALIGNKERQILDRRV